MSDKELIAECSQIIYDGFIRYNNHFHRMTRRARTRFEQRDWKGHQQDIVDRVDLYEKSFDASRLHFAKHSMNALLIKNSGTK